MVTKDEPKVYLYRQEKMLILFMNFMSIKKYE